MPHDNVRRPDVFLHRARNLAGESAVAFPKKILGGEMNLGLAARFGISQSVTMLNRRKKGKWRRDHYRNGRRRFGGIAGRAEKFDRFGLGLRLHLPAVDNETPVLAPLGILTLLRNPAASPGAIVEISMPVPNSIPPQIEVFGKISRCQ